MTRPDVQQAGERADLTGLGRPELAELADHLQPGERVLDVGTPLHAGVFGLLVLTDRRLLFRKVGRQATAVALDLADVEGVEWKRSFRGRSRLAVQTRDDELVFTELPNEQGAAIESGLRAARTTPRPAAPPARSAVPAPAPQTGGVRLDLAGRTALVTGSSQGIGLAIATGLARAGAAVVLTARGEARLAAAADQVRAAAEGAEVTTVAADVTSDAGTATLLAAVPDVDVLVNNLGVFGAQPALEIPDDEWRRYFEVNVLTAVRLIRAYLPGMRERGWGRALQIASDSAVVTPAEMVQYGVSTTALLAVSRGFAKEAAGSGVTVNSVIAGPTHTAGVEEFVRSLVGDLPWDDAQREFMRVHRPQSLLQRLIEPEEIANMVVYLASPLASATTGGALRVDGGYVDSILP
ncbi:SDR family NAD(P)-dependent oxidoreductase [Klenkia soli]|uniref:SDR family NAD(P)-dependent oxidoreductase n=1 Tax=Klenkia soli TaxID=1052260 RepID=UPI001F5FF665|nr:SDR family oxidoreductase [Klenkia soli]